MQVESLTSYRDPDRFGLSSHYPLSELCWISVFVEVLDLSYVS